MTFFLTSKDSKRRIAEAEKARKNRWEILTALSHGQVSRRELVKWGLFSGFGVLSMKHGLSPFVGSAYAAIPTGLPSSPLFGVQDFSAPMPRFDVLPRNPVSTLTDRNGIPLAPTAAANQTPQLLDPALPGVNAAAGLFGPIEGRPPGDIWAHQGWLTHSPQVAITATQRGNKGPNTVYNPQVANSMNSGIDPTQSIPLRFHPGLPLQNENSVWTFNGTVPPKLVIGRYGEPILFRHFNGLPANRTENNGFGVHTISTHEHNGHHGAENDGFAGAYFYPNQFYDYHWPIVLAGFRSFNAGATDPKAATPNDNDSGKTNIPGDWRETMSTHWFHDHMFSFTSQNVYKGNAAMFNIYSSIDRGSEIPDGVNLCLPSGKAKDWGNLDYDVNLMLADKAWGADGQMHFDIFNFDGFVGDQMTVNLVYKPYFEVERRKYRFRILNASVSRFFKIALSDGSPMVQIANDGNLLPRPVVLTQLDEQGIAERYDIIIDFSRYQVGQRVSMVNLAEHDNGLLVKKDRSLSDALSGKSSDPCVGKFLEFRIARDPADRKSTRLNSSHLRLSRMPSSA